MTISELRSRITILVPPLLTAFDGFLVDVVVGQEGRTCLVQVFIDTDAGVKIEQCAEASRELNRVVENAQLIDGAFRLEVSSPGLDRPLKLLRQYKKNIGREFNVRYRDQAETKALRGTLQGVDESRITFQPTGGTPLTLTYETILESIEVLPW